jgi:hypothetical protein
VPVRTGGSCSVNRRAGLRLTRYWFELPLFVLVVRRIPVFLPRPLVEPRRVRVLLPMLPLLMLPLLIFWLPVLPFAFPLPCANAVAPQHRANVSTKPRVLFIFVPLSEISLSKI